jgi:hypothetical protein
VDKITVASLVHTSIRVGDAIIAGSNDGVPALTHDVDAVAFRQWRDDRIFEGADVALLVSEHADDEGAAVPVDEHIPVEMDVQPEPETVSVGAVEEAAPVETPAMIFPVEE